MPAIKALSVHQGFIPGCSTILGDFSHALAYAQSDVHETGAALNIIWELSP
jgi:hypothetical protein